MWEVAFFSDLMMTGASFSGNENLLGFGQPTANQYSAPSPWMPAVSSFDTINWSPTPDGDPRIPSADGYSSGSASTASEADTSELRTQRSRTAFTAEQVEVLERGKDRFIFIRPHNKFCAHSRAADLFKRPIYHREHKKLVRNEPCYNVDLYPRNATLGP